MEADVLKSILKRPSLTLQPGGHNKISRYLHQQLSWAQGHRCNSYYRAVHFGHNWIVIFKQAAVLWPELPAMATISKWKVNCMGYEDLCIHVKVLIILIWLHNIPTVQQPAVAVAVAVLSVESCSCLLRCSAVAGRRQLQQELQPAVNPENILASKKYF